jgi:capsular polysaccharide biosynthesis protein
MELREYWRIIRRNLWLILIITIVTSLAAYYYAHKTTKPIYQATATLLTSSGNTSSQTGPDVTTLSAILTSQTFDQAVVAEFPSLLLTPSEIANIIQPTTSGSLIYITAVGPNEPYAASVANSVAQTIINQGSMFGLPNASLINPANPNSPAILKSSKKTVIMAGVIGLILSLGIAFLREYLDLRIKTEADMSRFLNIPVLGTVQEYKIKQKKSGKTKQKIG